MFWRVQGEVVPASEKDPEGWRATDRFTMVWNPLESGEE
jgi:hypothetical protein